MNQYRGVVWRNGDSRIEMNADGSWWPYVAYHASEPIYHTGIYHYRWVAILRTKMKHGRINRQRAIVARYKEAVED